MDGGVSIHGQGNYALKGRKPDVNHAYFRIATKNECRDGFRFSTFFVAKVRFETKPAHYFVPDAAS